ncbi:MAG: cytochrome c nitrite reductase small subunit [Myxococcales bacterium]|nr:cytochrome c nitrite reductase small subunit [Myxococcales bacterium]
MVRTTRIIPFAAVGILLMVAVGTAAGIGGYTFFYADGAAYMTNDPAACANCHVMQSQYDGWIKSSHRNVAVCNDCHTPEGPLNKWISKARNGWNHSKAFTTGNYPDPIRINQFNTEIVEQRCRSCHASIAETIEAPHHGGEPMSCIRCHHNVGHP